MGIVDHLSKQAIAQEPFETLRKEGGGKLPENSKNTKLDSF